MNREIIPRIEQRKKDTRLGRRSGPQKHPTAAAHQGFRPGRDWTKRLRLRYLETAQLRQKLLVANSARESDQAPQ